MRGIISMCLLCVVPSSVRRCIISPVILMNDRCRLGKQFGAKLEVQRSTTSRCCEGQERSSHGRHRVVKPVHFS
ncbi:hypothetical protein EDD18DRAFT_311014 [Armillaria luteobubalina]|uniref:Secreted protein n=1 Tax=Armillaria luteobubalina TaxID=153913 RepID=A0AA39QKP8_9AGAR|nr:hypothetical protein EDD18DRAFT_311014 [Armillaria luteobubalina]